MTWNIHGSARPDPGRIAAVLAAATPDVVCLQEVQRPTASAIAAATAMQHAWAFKHQPWRPLWPSRAEGMAILTPHRLDGAGHTELSAAMPRHSWRRRIIQWGLVARADGSGYRVYNLHLSPHDLDAERRDEGLRAAAIVAGDGDAPPAIVCGDLNQEPVDGGFAGLPGSEYVPAPPTHPANAPTVALDHVLLPDGAADVRVEVPQASEQWATLSDHLPVTVRFSLDWVDGDWTSAPPT